MGLDTTTSGFDAALKDVYLGPIRNQLNMKTRLLDLFTKGDIEQYEWEGRQVVLALRKSRNSGVASVPENGLLPTPGNQGYANLKVKMAFWEGRIQVTAQVMKASRSNKGSFARAMDTEQKGLIDDITRQRNRALALAGQGILAVISSGASSTTQSINNPGGVSGTANANRYIPDGTVVAITPDGVTIRGVVTVTSSTATQLTVTPTVSTTTGDFVVLGVQSGSTTQASYQTDPMGILGIVDSTTYVSIIHTLDRSQAANAFFRSTIMSSVGSLSMDVLQRGIDNAEETSGEVIDQFIAHASVRREVLKIQDADRRYTTDKMRPDIGTESGAFKTDLAIATIPCKVDKDFAYGTLIGVVKSHLFWIPEVEGEWADEDGSILFRVQNVDAYEARFRVFENFLSDRGNAHVRFDGITATVTSGVRAL